MPAFPSGKAQGRKVGFQSLPLAGGADHEEDPRCTTCDTRGIVNHFCHSSHDPSLVALVAKQEYMGIVVELEEAGVVGRFPTEDREENT